MKSKKLKLLSVRLDGDTQPRTEINRSVVCEYAELYRTKTKLPLPVVFFDGIDHWLADGFHRWHAANEAGLRSISFEVRMGTLDAARWYSYSVNQTHGLRRTNADKAKAVKAALAHPNGRGMSDHQIAEHLGVSQPMVSKYRAELSATDKDYQSSTRTGRDGRTTNTTNIGKTQSNGEASTAKASEPTKPESKKAESSKSEPPANPAPASKPQAENKPATTAKDNPPAAASSTKSTKPVDDGYAWWDKYINAGQNERHDDPVLLSKWVAIIIGKIKKGR